MKSITKVLLVSFLTLSMLSCDESDDSTTMPVQNEMNIVELAQNSPSLSNLVAALQAANVDLVSVLSGEGPFTVLAPTNDAFTAFLEKNNFNSLTDVPSEILTQVLLNHVIDGAISSTNLVELGSGYASTKATGAGNSPMSIYFDTTNGVTFNGVASVAQADITATNGIVHVIDNVIGLPTVVDFAISNPTFSNLVASLSAADGDLVSLLQNNGPFTVLAPTNEAFGTFLADNGFNGLSEVPTDALAQVLLNHVLNGSTLASDLINAEAGYTTTNAIALGNHVSLYFNATNGVTFNGMATVAKADVVAANGIIHVVDKVIGLPTIVDFALADPNFSTLVTALTRPDLTFDYVTTLTTPAGTAPAPFTIFAPTNDAFGDLLNELNITSLDELAEPILRATLDHHAVAGLNVRSSNLSDNFTVPTLGGEITANVSNGARLTDANNRNSDIIAFDVQASNGVIHVINNVILPPLN